VPNSSSGDPPMAFLECSYLGWIISQVIILLPLFIPWSRVAHRLLRKFLPERVISQIAILLPLLISKMNGALN